jgi:hypothetical protein
MSFPAGDALLQALQGGDSLHLARTSAGGVGVSLLRANRLILALGAATAVPLGQGITVGRGTKRVWEPEEMLAGSLPGDTWLDFTIESDTQRLQARQAATISSYDIYVERDWAVGVPGVDECVSIAAQETVGFRDAAMRSAILLAAGCQKIRGWEFFGENDASSGGAE